MANSNTIKNSVYAEEIFKLAEDKKNEIFYNSSAEHAIIVHQALVKTATNYMYIFSSSMCTEISNNSDYCNLVKAFLRENKNRQIKIVLTDYNDGFALMPIAKLLAEFPLQVSIKRYPGEVYYKDKPVHFTITDDRAFRLETDINNHMAFGNFNSPDQAKAMKAVFEKVYQSKLASSVTLC